MRLQYFLYSVKKGNKCRFVRHPGRNRQEERYLPTHISESVKATRHPGGHVSLATDATRLSLETTRDILEQERTCYVRFDSSRLYTCVYIVVSYHTYAYSIQKNVARPGNRLNARAVDCMMDASGLT